MNQSFLWGGRIMRVFLLGVLLTACTVASDEVTAYCNGLTNDNTRVEIKLDIDNDEGTVMVDEDSTFGFLVANKFNYVWETRLGNMMYTNILNKLDGSMVVLVPNPDPNQAPVLRAQLICVEEQDIKFE
tara:strand:+ start:296 stop:682 length:387 start_codon:yes stop_codon:yes gene_type:complete